MINRFGTASGSKLNVDKTKGLVFNDHAILYECKVELTRGPEIILGIPMGKNISHDEFWISKIEKLKASLQVWKTRHLSFKGRVHLIKSVGIPSFLYAVEMREVNSRHVQDIMKIIWSFIWKDRKPLVKRETCTLTREMGGINITGK